MLNLQPTASIGSLMLRGNHTPQANNFPLPVTIYCLLLSPDVSNTFSPVRTC